MNHKELIERLRTSPAFDNTTLGNEAADAIEALQEIILNVEHAHATVADAYRNVLQEHNSLRQQLSEAQRDAERYRFLFNGSTVYSNFRRAYGEWDGSDSKDGFDAVIDAAIAAMKGAA